MKKMVLGFLTVIFLQPGSASAVDCTPAFGYDSCYNDVISYNSTEPDLVYDSEEQQTYRVAGIDEIPPTGRRSPWYPYSCQQVWIDVNDKTCYRDKWREGTSLYVLWHCPKAGMSYYVQYVNMTCFGGVAF